RAFTDNDMKGYDSITDFLATAKITPTRVKYREQVDVDFFKP
ncbi:MAG: hypothetical protein JWP52_527, partial [Rhizobacter sp.]|nr:hypothetical protein [Rhizobacter sp.]